MSFSWDFPYPSQRMPVLARNVVATSQPLAAQAGLRMLLNGGNAVDAALATAIALTVVEPTSNGIGSDAFAILWDGENLQGLNSSGRSPKAWSLSRFAGREAMPASGWDTVTVPGAVAAWAALSQRWGKLPFTDLFQPAITYARHGFMVSPITARRWQEAQTFYPAFAEINRVFFPSGRAPRAGEMFRCPDQADTLAAIAESRGDAFYRGAIAKRIAACAAAEGGALTLDDLAGHTADWVTPLAIDYRHVRLHEIPPNGQGIAALIALGILRTFRPGSASRRLRRQHSLANRGHEKGLWRGVPACGRHRSHANYPRRSCWPRNRLAGHASAIRRDRASQTDLNPPAGGGTVYLTAADESGMMVSYIQSNYMGFGSGVVVPGTGIALQNRGLGFVLEEGHPNCVAGNKRPFHTIIPAFVTQNDRPLMSLGVMGAHMQPQGHVQMMVRIFDYGQNPQAACDAPRWHVAPDGSVQLEPGIPSEVIESLRDRGHRVTTGAPASLFGGAQMIFRLQDGYVSASDPRKDGQAVGF